MDKAIIKELIKAIQGMTEDPTIRSIVGSYGDTLEDEEILGCLEDFNLLGECLFTIQ